MDGPVNPARIAREAMLLRSDRERARYLEAACAGDPGLRRRVEALIGAGRAAISPTIDTRGVAEAGAPVPAPLPAAVAAPLLGFAPGDRIGRYRLIEILGAGGFGVVWRAEQVEPLRREVAVKVIKPGMDSAAVLARFEQERQALAVMDHTFIARVLDGGATDRGLPYFVMELVRGESITAFCDREHLGIDERLELFIGVCEAVQHAHMKGVIHRDLKPSNILIAFGPDGGPTPRVIDFGVAKALNQRLTEHAIFTEHGQMIGTPEYMSPEQAEMSGVDIDTRTDVYSLGVVLYELLTGTLPFDPKSLRAAALVEIQRIIREVQPPRPSTRIGDLAAREREGGPSSDQVLAARGEDPRHLSGVLRRDLDWVVMRCLEKDRGRRYATPMDLAADLRRFLTHMPVVAGPPSARYRAGKFVRRHRAGLALATTFVVLLGAGLTGTSLMYTRASAERVRAERQAKISSAVVEFLNDDLLGGGSAERGGRGAAATTILDAARRVSGTIDGRFPDPLVEAAVREAVARVLCSLGESSEGLRQIGEALAVRERELGERDPETIGTMRLLGMYQSWNKDYDASRATFEREASLRLSVEGPASRAYWWTLQQLSGVLASQGKIEEAERIESRLTELRTEWLGAEHADTLAWRRSIAVRMQQRGRTDDALDVMREVSSISDRVRGPTDDASLYFHAHIAGLHEVKGELDRAETIWREVLGVRRAQGATGPLLGAIRGLAWCLHLQGRDDDAETLLREAIEIEGASSDQGDAIGATASMLATIYEQDETPDESIDRQREALDRLNESFGPAYVQTTSASVALANLYMETKRFVAAERLLDETIAALRAARGERHLDLAEPLGLRAQLLWERGQFRESAAMYAEAVAIAEGGLPQDTEWLLWTIAWRARAERDAGMWSEAEASARDLYARRVRFSGTTDVSTFSARRAIGESLAGQGRHEEALATYAPLLDDAVGAIGEDDVLTMWVMQLLGYELAALGRWREAEAMYMRQYNAQAGVRGADDPVLTWSLGAVAWARLNNGDDVGARELYTRVYARQRAEGTESEARQIWTALTLADLYRRLGDLTEAEPIYRRTADMLRDGHPNASGFLHWALGGLAATLEGSSDFAGAERVRLEAYAACVSIHGSAHEHTRAAVVGLAELYERWESAEPGSGRAVTALEWRTKLEEPPVAPSLR